jgi:predicted AlkP superfamily phosphohydrolase/phosphomutase
LARIGLVARRLLAPCVALSAVLACAEPPAGRVLLVGIDGASPRIATPLIREGRLPHLAALASAGVYAPLRSHPPITSPRIWTSIATGMLPDRHGILGFGYTDERGVRRLFSSTERTAPAIWNIASAAGRRVAVVNWWNTYPPERIDGVIVSDHLLVSDIRGRKNITGSEEETLGTIAWPVEWDARAKARLEDDTPLTDVPDPFTDPKVPGWAKPERLSQRYQNDADVVRIALDVEAAIEPDLMLVFLPGIDRVSHVLWATLEPPAAYKSPMPMTEETRAAGAEALYAYYAYTDALIGRLLERYDPERDLVMVVSDHGFEAGQKLGYLTGTHDTPEALDGVLFAAGPGIARPSGRHLRFSVNDVTPTLLAWMGMAPAQDMDGRPLPILSGPEPVFVASHADTPIERLPIEPSGAEDEILEQLGALGYLEDGGGDEAE